MVSKNHYKHIISNMKLGGGGIRLWGGFSAAGPRELWKVDKDWYHQILKDHLTQSARELVIQQKLHKHGSETTWWWFWSGQGRAQITEQPEKRQRFCKEDRGKSFLKHLLNIKYVCKHLFYTLYFVGIVLWFDQDVFFSKLPWCHPPNKRAKFITDEWTKLG